MGKRFVTQEKGQRFVIGRYNKARDKYLSLINFKKYHTNVFR